MGLEVSDLGGKRVGVFRREFTGACMRTVSGILSLSGGRQIFGLRGFQRSRGLEEHAQRHP